jgi:hypothetical protein
MTKQHRRRDETPDSHLFPTRPYDLVKEFVIALGVVIALTVVLAAVFSSPDRKAITLKAWAQAAPRDVASTAAAELAGTSTSASYGPPYNHASSGQQLGPLYLQKWAGVRIPINSANAFVIDPLSNVAGDPRLVAALRAWRAAPVQLRTAWATRYGTALAAHPGLALSALPGAFGPVPVLVNRYVVLARTGGLDSLISRKFYPTNQTRTLLLLADGSYLEDQARAENLGGDQWGMMNEAGNYPGQPWMWLYTFWYQIEPFSSSGNADALVWGLMVVLTLGLMFLPFIPGLRALPKHLGVHKLIWRQHELR